LKQYQVLVDPLKLKNYGVTLHDVEATIAGSNINATGGFLLSDYQEGLIRNIARIKTLDDLAKSPLPKENGSPTPLTLDQVADALCYQSPFVPSSPHPPDRARLRWPE
jgi:Cu/Ag efflux pump CusA